MKPYLTLTALCQLAIATPCFADTFTLKDGTNLEAKIVSETPVAYLLEVQVSKSIKDKRTVAKADVAKVSREQPDFKAFQVIAGLVPTPDLITTEDGLARIAQVEKFLKDFGTASSAKEAKVILLALKKESAAISAGSIKIGGSLVSAAEYEANTYDLDAQIEATKIRNSVDEGELLAALRLFSDFDANFPTTLSHGALVPLIRQVIQNQISEAKQSLLTLPDRLKGRELGLSRMVAEDRATSQAALKEETSEHEARYKSETNSKFKWVTTDPFHKASLEDTVKTGESELIRLAAIKTVLGGEGGKSFREVYKAVHEGGNGAAVAEALARAKTALVPARYLAPLENAAKGRK